MEMLHYSNKVQELKGSQKATDEKKDRNKEKYAQASQALRDQTNQLMSIFAHAEQLRQRLLTQDLPAVVTAEKNAFDSFAINLNKAAAETSDGEPRPPRMSDAARIPQRCVACAARVAFFLLLFFFFVCTPVAGSCRARCCSCTLDSFLSTSLTGFGV